MIYTCSVKILVSVFITSIVKYQILQSLDMLRKAPKLNMSDLESSETIGALHTLYTMTLTPLGQYGVFTNNMRCL